MALLSLLCGCNTSIGMGAGTGNTRVGGSIGSGGSVVGIGTSMGSGVAVSTYKDVLRNGPSDINENNREGLEALKNGDFAIAEDIFEESLERYPNHPDATYYLGLTRIYQEDRKTGFTLLKTYRDPDYYRMTTAVQRTAKLLEEKPELTPDKIHESMNRNRNDGYNQDIRERQQIRSW